MATVIPRLTKAGAILLAKALAGSALVFTRGALGNALIDGQRTDPSEQEIDDFTDLIHRRMWLPIIDFKIENHQLIVTLKVSNAGVTTSFRIAEGGLFAKDPDSDSEVLYCYFYDGIDGDRMPVDDGIQLEYEYTMITAISNAQNVTCVIDKSKIEVTRAEFDAHINSTLPHPNWDVVLHPEFNSHVETFNEHVASSLPHPNWDVVLHPEFNEHVASSLPHPNWATKLFIKI